MPHKQESSGVAHFYGATSGDILYHYTTLAGAEAILRNRTLRLSEFSKMNDETEYTYARAQFVDAYQNREVFVEEVPRYLANIQLNAHEPSTVMLIGCLTEDRDDVGLWERYADKGTGCVLGIDALWLEQRAGVAIKRVSYDPMYLRDFVNAGLLMLQHQYEQAPNDLEELRDLASLFVLDLYAFKDPRFRSENEVRISRLVALDPLAPHGLVDPGGTRSDGTAVAAQPVELRNGRYGPTRYIDLPITDVDGTTAIRSVGFGRYVEPSDEQVLRVLGANSVAFWKSDAPFR